ncbi:MAG: hypothetical protein LC687_05230 [Actinobacteria bacterium]|nr:hypothetical protein [Actinomycetota bacterium]
MEDDEYEGKMKSVIQAVFPANELADDLVPDTTDDDEDAEYVSDDEDAEEVAVDDGADAGEVAVDDDEEEEDEEPEAEEPDAEEGDQFTPMDRNQLKRFIKKIDGTYSVRRSQSDDDLRQVARELSAADADEADDDPDELEIEDL